MMRTIYMGLHNTHDLAYCKPPVDKIFKRLPAAGAIPPVKIEGGAIPPAEIAAVPDYCWRSPIANLGLIAQLTSRRPAACCKSARTRIFGPTAIYDLPKSIFVAQTFAQFTLKLALRLEGTPVLNSGGQLKTLVQIASRLL